ncbi:unnamed protein product [Polarella glacialis]|uniref:Uncharacterized protein n=1 Tax=Polarella glacialis TaxID=89957 RepID=A0A813I1R9_POLGL|nr:unnamed protein product [Polarella glacialis]
MTLLKVHLCSAGGPGIETASFFRSLLRKAFLCPSLSYEPLLRKSCVQSLEDTSAPSDEDGQAASDANVRRQLRHLLSASGHTACSLEHLVVVVGGWRKERPADTDLALCVVNFGQEAGGAFPRLLEPRLAPGSARPTRRLRHSCCVVRPDFLPCLEGCPLAGQAVLVLGGCDDQSHRHCPGLNVLSLLQFTQPDGSEAVWHEVEASGDAPRSIWHHVAGPFARGKRVVVFGGDFEASDPEFRYIQDRNAAAIVYVLDVDARRWERVETSGRRPSWRSLHAGVTYESLADASERLVVFGGCETHCEIFSSGEAVGMRGHALDLQSFTWLMGPVVGEGGFVPVARLRFAAERFGRFLLAYGGHGSDIEVEDDECVIKLNLLTLSWDRVRIWNRPHGYRNIPASTLSGGAIIGGVQPSPFGLSAVVVIVAFPPLFFLFFCFIVLF